MRLNAIGLILAALLFYIGVRLLMPFEWPVRACGAALLAVLFHAMPKGWRTREGGRPWVAMLPWFALGFFSWLLVLTVARDVSVIAVGLLADLPAHDAWTRISAIGVMAATPVIAAIGYFMARRVAPVVEVDIPLAGLPDALHGFTIAQISDVHVGPTIKRAFVEGIVERVNAMDADVVAITGDVVDGSVRALAHHTAPLSRLRARAGPNCVTGNHPYRHLRFF